MDENISRAAGANHGQEADEDDFHAMVDALGRPLEQRTTLYGRITTVGKRLRPAPEPHAAPDGAVPVVLRPAAPVQA
jgi:FO synthase